MFRQPKKEDVLGFSCKVSIFLLEFNKIWSSLTDFHKKVPIIKVQGRPVGAELMQGDGRRAGERYAYEEPTRRLLRLCERSENYPP
jgi:hypothetical protein